MARIGRAERAGVLIIPRVTICSELLETKGSETPLSNIVLDLCAEPCNNYAVPLDEFGGVVPLAEVRLQEGESLENALRRFKRKVQQEDIIKEVKRHSFYLKPGEKKRVKEALARKRSRKKARKEQD
jgi:small subunit ribosomal protein S21